MAAAPQFSVVIPTFNRADSVERAVRSVLSQTCADVELIVVDDASVDGTSAVLRGVSRSHSNVRVHTNAENLERSNSRNIGVQLARGQYVCFLDSDDYYEPNHLQVLADQIARSRTAKPPIIFTLTTFVDRDSGEESRAWPTAAQICDPRLLLTAGNLISMDAACIRRDVVAQHPFNPELASGEDTDLFLRLSTHYPIEVCQRHTSVAITTPQSEAEHRRKIDSFHVRHTALRDRHLFPRSHRHRALSTSHYQLAASEVEAGRRALAIKHCMLSICHSPIRGARRSSVILVLAIGGAKRTRTAVKKVRRIAARVAPPQASQQPSEDSSR